MCSWHTRSVAPSFENSRPPGTRPTSADTENGHFSASLLYAAAKLYYSEDATQAEVAAQLGTSRATVSRLLAEAKRRGIVRIEVVAPDDTDGSTLADQVSNALHLDRVYLSLPLPTPGTGRSTLDVMGGALAPPVSRALIDAELMPGDVLLVSSGRTVYEVSQFDLPALAGVNVVPTVGGNDQPEAWYQTNEITRLVSSRTGGRPNYLFAPALPGADLYRTLLTEPSIERVLRLWPQARCALLGIGAPPLLRTDIPQFVPTSSDSLRESVGDVCSRFFDRDGDAVHFEGAERLMAVELEVLREIPVTVGVAVGADKVDSIIAAARGGYITRLVTDPATAQLLADRAQPLTPADGLPHP